MPSKLGIHHNTGREINRFAEFYHLAQPAVALHLDLGDTEFAQMIDEQSPDTLIVGRKFFDSQPLNSPENKADSAARGILESSCARAGLIDTWVGYNEIGPHPTHDYLRFQQRLRQRLHDADQKYASGSWSVGTPDVPDWHRNDQGGLSLFHEELRIADFLALHSYCAPTMNDPRGLDADHPGEGWFTLRYRKMMRVLRSLNLGFDLPPLLMTEIGIDSGATHWDAGTQGGWKSFTDAPGYMEQLAWYDSFLQGDPEVIGACVFQAGDISGDWGSFELIGPMLDHLQNYMVEQRGQQPGPDPLPEWIDDLRGKLRVHEAKTYSHRELDTISRVIIHHSAVAPSVGAYQFAEYHVGVKDWPGIGYHFTVGTDGHVYQTNDLEAISYHASGNNEDSIGICLHGSWIDGLSPGDSQLRATARLLEHLEEMVDVGGNLEVRGHQEVADTRCPGDDWMEWRWELLPEQPSPEPDWEALYREEKAKVEAVRAIVC